MKLADKSKQVFNFLKEVNEEVALPAVAQALGLTDRQVSGCLISLVNKYGLVNRESREGAEGKKITFLSLTAAGQEFDADAEDAE